MTVLAEICTWASDNTLLSAAVFLAVVCGVMLPLTSAVATRGRNELRERVKQADARSKRI